MICSCLAKFTTYPPNEGPFGHISNEEFAHLYLSKDLSGADEWAPYFDGSWDFTKNPGFDWRTVDINGKSCVHEILNQGSCGSCWSFGTSEFLSDRLCIVTQGNTDVVLAPQFLVDCDEE